MNYLIEQISISDKSIYALSSFFESIYGENTKLTYDYLSWFYRDNPAGSVIGFNAFDESNNIIAHYALVPISGCLFGNKSKLVLSVNTATAKTAQGKGLFKKLASLSYDLAKNKGYQGVIGVANQNSTHGFTKSLGFQFVCQLDARVSFFSPQHVESKSPTDLKISYSESSLIWRLKNPNAIYNIKSNSYIYTPTSIFFKSILMLINKNDKFDIFHWPSNKKISVLNLWVGMSNLISWKGTLNINLPNFLRPAPLNLIFKDLVSDRKINKKNIHFEAINFDAY